MKIPFYRKNVYGKELIYILGVSEAFHPVWALTGKLTINPVDIASLKCLGHTFEEVLAPSAK